MLRSNLAARVNAAVNSRMERLENCVDVARAEIISKMHDALEPYIPYNTGKLNDSFTEYPGHTGFEYVAEYAPYAFAGVSKNGKPFEYNKRVHPKATSEPINKVIVENEVMWQKEFMEAVLRRFNGG